MGIDIAVHTEIKVNGKWEHLGHPHIPRDYELFAKMNGNRFPDMEYIEPITDGRELPYDLSIVTDLHFEHHGMNDPYQSWLTLAETEDLEGWYREKYPEKAHGLHEIFGYLFSNGFDTSESKYYSSIITDFRIIFWFN